LLLVGGGALAMYLALRIDGARRAERNAFTPDRLLWVQQHQALAWGLLFMGLFVGGMGFFGVAAPVRLFLLPAAALGLAYGWPLLPLPLRWRLRRRNFLKIVLSGLVWAWVSVVLPGVGGDAAGSSLVWWLFGSRFLLVVGVTLPFDIRDIEQDRIVRLETVATAFGVRRTQHLAWICLAGSCGLMLGQLSPALWLAYSAPCALAAWGVAQARPDGREYWYLGLLDGTVVLQAVLVGVAVA